MARPLKIRKTCCNPSAYYYKPRGIPVSQLDEIILEPDELEALHLADLNAFSHEVSAGQMNISRATFGRIIERARKKIADGIINGKAIKIKQTMIDNLTGVDMTETNDRFTGKIAIATNDEINVAGHPGRCRAFMIYEIINGVIENKECRENTFTHHRAGNTGEEHYRHEDNNHHGHSHETLIIALKDCSFFIAKSGGWRIVEDLKNNNITPLFTSVEQIETAVELFLNGELKNDVELVCHHH